MCVEQGALREALEDTCQEHRGGARTCTRYGTYRTKYRTEPRYKYLQATPYQIRRSLKTSMTPKELPGKILYTQKTGGDGLGG